MQIENTVKNMFFFILMFYFRAYLNSEEISHLFDLFDEDVDYDFIDKPDYETECIKENCHSSDSEVILESGDDSVLKFFIGMDGENLWSNNAVSC